MRVLFSSVSVAAALVTFCSAQASPIHEDSSPFAQTDNFAIRLGSASQGLSVIDGYRTMDGRNFYHDDSSSKLRNGAGPTLSNGAGPLGFFAATDERGSDARPTLSSNSSGSLSSNRGSGGSFSGGGNGISLGFGGAQAGFGVGGSSPLKGLNPLNSAYATLTADHGGFPEISEGGGKAISTPLPPAWTLMLIGLAGFGYAAFRLKSRSAGLTAA